MKTLKQIREEHDNATLSQVQVAPGDLMLEGRESDIIKKHSIAPPFSQMPAMLLFRRIAYRLYPNKQTVALYYSKTVDKYLSIPFGPDGNLNLSESSVYNTMEELDIAEGAKWEAAKGALKGAIHGTIRGGAIGGVIAPGPGTALGAAIGGARGAIKGAKIGYEKGKAKDTNEAFKANLSKLREGFLKDLLDITTAKPGVQQAAYGDTAPVTRMAASSGAKKQPKVYSGFTATKHQDDIATTRYKQKLLEPQKTVKENKITDIRDMVDSGVDLHEMDINGRTVTLNSSMAKRILEVYDSVNTKNKKIVESMLNEDLESFKKLLNFSIKV